MTAGRHLTQSLDRAANDALRSLDPAANVDPDLAHGDPAQQSLARILATSPAEAAMSSPARALSARGPGRRWVLACAALVGIAALVVAPGMRQGGPSPTTVPRTAAPFPGTSELASWSSVTNKSVMPAWALRAGNDCKTRYIRSGSLGPAAGIKAVQTSVITLADRRDGWTFVLLTGGVRPGLEVICLYRDVPAGRGTDGGGSLGYVSTAPVAPNMLVSHGTGGFGGGDVGYWYAIGRVGSDVASVLIHPFQRGPVRATIHQGYFAAWWPMPDMPSIVPGKPDLPPDPTITYVLNDGTTKTVSPSR